MIYHMQIQKQSEIVTILKRCLDDLQTVVDCLHDSADTLFFEYQKQYGELKVLQEQYVEQERNLAILRDKGFKVSFYGSQWLVAKGDKQKSYASLHDAKKGVAESDFD
jgi:hypothetical protein